MKTIAFKDRAGGAIKAYFVEGQTRHERIKKALAELGPVANINIYLVKGNKLRLINQKQF